VPEDVDVILQPKAPYGPEAFVAMEPFFVKGIEAIFEEYSVHLHFWCEGFPGGMSDFRRFFQYLRPQDAAPMKLQEGARKGIVRVRGQVETYQGAARLLQVVSVETMTDE
jgi:hypothetical protein